MKEKEKITKVTGNGLDPVQDWGIIHCAECETPIAYFPPDVLLEDDDNVELYCRACAIALKQREQ